MIRDFLRHLNQPFPSKGDLRSSVRSQFYVALFIAGFLFLFKPFGMRYAPNQLILSAAFGVVSFLFSLSFDLFCRFILKIKTDVPSWTLWKWLVQSLLMVSWIAFGNHLLQLLLFGGQLSNITQWFKIWQATLTLGSIPVFVSGLIVQMRAVKNNVQQAGQIELSRQQNQPTSAQAHTIEIALSSSESLSVSATDLRFVEAMQNYVLMHIQDGDTVSRHMVRNTITKTLEQFQNSGAENIIRCHRSFLVNVDSIASVKGNAQGLKLAIESYTDTLVPVSRSYIPGFKAALKLATRPTLT